MTRIYYQIKVRDTKEPGAVTTWFYSNTHYTQEQAIADAQIRLTETQTAEYIGFEFV